MSEIEKVDINKYIALLLERIEELTYLLALYIDSDYENGTDDLTWQAIEYLQKIKQKPINEIIEQILEDAQGN